MSVKDECHKILLLIYMEYIVFSSGFAIETSDDSVVPDVNGVKRKLLCGTEKGRYKCKNFRTASNYKKL